MDEPIGFDEEIPHVPKSKKSVSSIDPLDLFMMEMEKNAAE